jgi:hypothetical protein
VSLVALAWGIRTLQGPGERPRPDRSTYRVRTLHEGDHAIAPGQSITVPFEWGSHVLRMRSVPPDLQPYEEPEDRLQMSVSISEGGKADVWLVSQLAASSTEGKRPAARPPEATDPFSRAGAEGTYEVTYAYNLPYCSFILANPSDTRPVTVHLKLRRGYWLIQPQP